MGKYSISTSTLCSYDLSRAINTLFSSFAQQVAPSHDNHIAPSTSRKRVVIHSVLAGVMHAMKSNMDSTDPPSSIAEACPHTRVMVIKGPSPQQALRYCYRHERCRTGSVSS